MQEQLKYLTVAFSKPTMKRTQVQFWFNNFKADREDVNDDACSGPPSTTTTDENIKTMKKMILVIIELLLEMLLIVRAYHLAHAEQF